MDSTPPTLLERLKSSDNQEAWEQFHELYGKRIWARANQTLGVLQAPGDWSQDGHQFVADVCQEAVLKVFLNLRNFIRQGDGSFRVWLDTIVRNEIVNEIRRAKRRPPSWSQANIEDLCARLTDERQDFHVFTKQEHDRHLVGIALDWLRREFPSDRVDVFLRLVKGDAKAEEVAHEFGLTVPNVYLLKHHLTKKLRDYMDRHLADFLD
jgi:RNA polymerase sigma factor (sigma-70 family)